jgi:hypothetical protein
MKKLICHSGGAYGSDLHWGNEVLRLGGTVNHYYYNKKTPFGNICISEEDFLLGSEKILEANKILKRYPYKYMELLSRNYAQVKYSDSIYAVGKLLNYSTVDGGTGWAVQMAINESKPVYVLNQTDHKWYKYNYDLNIFEYIENITIETINFAGIGTREIDEQSKQMITNLLEKNI